MRILFRLQLSKTQIKKSGFSKGRHFNLTNRNQSLSEKFASGCPSASIVWGGDHDDFKSALIT